MAFILKSTKFIHSLVGCSCQRVLRDRRKHIFSSNNLRACVITDICNRTTVSLATQQQHSFPDLDQLFFRLNGDIRNKRVLLQNVQSIVDVLKQKGEMTEPQTMLLLKCCSEASFSNSPQERLNFAEQIWKAAESLSADFNISHYNVLLNVFLENNHEFSPSEFLLTLKKKGIEPNLVTYKRLLKAYCQMGDIEGASNLLKKMKELDLPLSEDDFSALIQCHCQVGNFEKANEILNLMQEKDIDPTSKTYLNLLCGYVKHGKVEKMKELLNVLAEKEVYLSSVDYLEIIYALAVNNEDKHIDMILERITNHYGCSTYAKVIIHRLLHQQKDSVALQLFEKLEGEGQSTDYILSRSKFILKHFAVYRDPNVALELGKKMEEKGWARSAVSFILRQTFLHKNENECLNFIRAMQALNMEIRSHYFWPAIIKASKKGNKEMMRVIKTIPPRMLAFCQYTTTKIIFPNYNFSDNWFQDNEFLRKLGLPQKWLSVSFIEKLLREEKLAEVERLVSQFTVDVERYNHLLNLLVDYVQQKPEEVDHFVNILYYLSHDFHLRFSKNPSNVEDESIALNSKNFFDVSLIVFLRLLRDEEVFKQVLEKMREKKYGITAECVSEIEKTKKVPNLMDKIRELADLQPQNNYNSDILKLKTETVYKNDNNLNYKPFSASDEIDLEVIKKQLLDEQSYLKAIMIIRNLIRVDKYEEALQLTEILPNVKESVRDSSQGRLFFLVLRELCNRNQIDFAEKVFFKGIDMGILRRSDYVNFLRILVSRGEISLAVDKYCKHIENTKNVSRSLEFMVTVVAEGSEEDFRRVASLLSGVVGKDMFMTQLVIAFAENGDVKKAKKILETKKFKFQDRRFYAHCRAAFRTCSSKVLENYLAVVKDLEFFDRVPLYKLIIKKYAKEENIDNIKQLWLFIEEDDISDYYFLEQMHELMENPTVERLKEIAETLQDTELSFQTELDQFKELIDKESYDLAFKVAITETVQLNKVKKLCQVFASRGNIFEVLELFSRYPLENYTKRIAYFFIKDNRYYECLEFLNYFIIEKKFDVVADCFDTHMSLHFLEKTDGLFEWYKSMVTRCFVEGGMEFPLITFFVSCVILPGLKEEAEKLWDQYSDYLGSAVFNDMYRKPLTLFQEINFYVNLISSERLKSHFSDHLPFIYSSLLRLNCENNDVQSAVDILNKAVSEGLGMNIEKKFISLLKESMEANGMDFPYPELLAET